MTWGRGSARQRTMDQFEAYGAGRSLTGNRQYGRRGNPYLFRASNISRGILRSRMLTRVRARVRERNQTAARARRVVIMQNRRMPRSVMRNIAAYV